MRCNRCGEQLPQGCRYCGKCGKYVGGGIPTWGWLIIGAVALAAAFCIAFLCGWGADNPPPPEATNTATAKPAVTQTGTSLAVNEEPVWPPVERPALLEHASAESLFEKGMAYLNKNQYFNGLAYIGLAANEGNYSAQYRLYLTYNNGDGKMPQEDAVAAYWKRVSARQNENRSDSQAGKGALAADARQTEYEQGVQYFRDQEYSSAIAYLGVLANEGDADAQYMLGQCYLEGVTKERYAEFSVEYDAIYTAGVYWTQLAAEQGHCCAQGYLGYCYRTGRGVEPDLATAFAWDRQSAGQNCAFGLIHLGYFYADPENVLQFAEKNYDIARMFYEAAEAAEHDYAATRLRELDALVAQSLPEELARMKERSEGITIQMIITGQSE